MISRDQSDKVRIVWLSGRLTGEFRGEAVVVVSALGDGVSEEHDAVLHVSCHDVLVWQEGQETEENRTGVSARCCRAINARQGYLTGPTAYS